MSRYIDAEKLGIGTARPEALACPEYAAGWNSAIEIIKNAPTADVVEVVRCKDCKYFMFMDYTFGRMKMNIGSVRCVCCMMCRCVKIKNTAITADRLLIGGMMNDRL